MYQRLKRLINRIKDCYRLYKILKDYEKNQIQSILLKPDKVDKNPFHIKNYIVVYLYDNKRHKQELEAREHLRSFWELYR